MTATPPAPFDPGQEREDPSHEVQREVETETTETEVEREYDPATDPDYVQDPDANPEDEE